MIKFKLHTDEEYTLSDAQVEEVRRQMQTESSRSWFGMATARVMWDAIVAAGDGLRVQRLRLAESVRVQASGGNMPSHEVNRVTEEIADGLVKTEAIIRVTLRRRAARDALVVALSVRGERVRRNLTPLSDHQGRSIYTVEIESNGTKQHLDEMGGVAQRAARDSVGLPTAGY